MMKKRTVVLCVISLILAVALSVTASGGLEDNCTININIVNEQRNIVSVSGIVGIDTLVSVRIYNPGFSGSDVDLTAAQADTSAIQFFGTTHSQNGEFSLNVPMNTSDGGEFTVEVTVDETRYSDTFTFYPYAKQMWCISTVKNATNATALAASVPEIMEIYGFADHELYQATTAQAVANAIVASNVDATLVIRSDLDIFLQRVLVLTAFQAKNETALFTDGKMNCADILGIDTDDWYLDYSNSTPILSADGYAGVKSDLLSGNYTTIEDIREKFVESMCYHAIMNSANNGSSHVAGLLDKYDADYTKAGFELDLLETATGQEKLFDELIASDATDLNALADVFNDLFSIGESNDENMNVRFESDGTVKLSVLGGNADRVQFYINGTMIHEFDAPSAGGIYTYVYTPDSNGLKQFDAYIFSGDNETMLSRTFTVAKNGVVITHAQGVNKLNLTRNNNIISGNSVYATGRVCFEGDFTPSALRNYLFEIGANSENRNSTSSSDTGYILISTEMQEDKYLFNQDGTLWTSDETYAAGQKMHIKLVIDMDADQYEFYVDGKLIATKAGGDDSLKAATNLCHRIRLNIKNGSSNDATTTASFENFKLYQEVLLPQVAGVAYNGIDAATAGGYVVPETATTVTVTLDREYAAVTAENISVTLDDEAVNATVAYDKNTKTITLTGLDLTSGGQLEVTVNENATMTVTTLPTSGSELTTENVPAGQKLVIPILVGNTDLLAVLPVKKVTIADNNFASYKYLNAGAAINARLILSHYQTVSDGLFLLDKAVVETARLGKGKVGMIGASMTESVDKAFLWDINTLKPLVDVAK